MKTLARALSLLLAVAFTGAALAQGVQSGVLTGRVTSSDGQPLPGVSITVSSPALQGVRTTQTTANGDYIFKSLPSGSYKVAFELSGFGTVEKNVGVSLETLTLDTRMNVSSVQETVVVTADAPTVLENTQAGATYNAREIDTIATSRTIAGIAELSPGLTDNTPNAAQVTISGGFAYDNLFMVDGVDVTDSTFGTPNDVFIEDAIEETQVLTSGISSEFGRFGGGAINVITKRGGNDWSGSFRTDLSNAAWRDETPFEDENDIERESKVNQVYSATLGGPIVKDRLWFFVAGRRESRSNQDTFDFSGIPFTSDRTDKRIEGKLNGQIAPNHNLQLTYTHNDTEDASPTFSFSVAPDTFDTNTFPQRLFAAKYDGVLSPNLFAEVQYSHQSLGFRDVDGTDTNVNTGSPIFTFGNSADVQGGLHYNAPYFDYATDPQDRTNQQVTANLSYFLSTASTGRHDLKGGVEYYRNTFKGGNSQSPTNAVYYADYLTDGSGNPVLDSEGNLTPHFIPFGGLFLNWLPERGAELNVKTTSFYLNDRWQLGSRWNFNLGLRYERVRSDTSSTTIAGLNTDTIVPRLGATFDVKGDGRYTLQATYSHYAGSYNLSQFGNNQGAGNPDLVYGLYVGPEGSGLDFAPGFDPGNYFFLGGAFPQGNTTFDSGLSSPVSKEYTFAAGMQLGKDGYVKAIYTNRHVEGFVEDFYTIDQGASDISTPAQCIGCDQVLLDNRTYRNSDEPTREYQGLTLLLNYRLAPRWSFAGHYTYQIRNFGNFEGENTNQPAISSRIGDYPEMLVPGRNFPEGRLNDFQRHKVRAWTTYDFGMGRFGNLNLGLLWRYDSALTYSLAAGNQSISDVQASRDPGYANGPGIVTVYFGPRGVGDYAGVHQFDFAATYDIKAYKKLRPYVKVDIRNIMNKTVNGAGLSGFNTTISPDNDGPVDADGIPTQYIQSPNFGEATGAGSYNFPREFRMALGFRF
jgi:outer membrane receptor protein involved in Fe transport